MCWRVGGLEDWSKCSRAGVSVTHTSALGMTPN